MSHEDCKNKDKKTKAPFGFACNHCRECWMKIIGGPCCSCKK